MTEPTHCVMIRDDRGPWWREVTRGSRDYCDGWVNAMRQAFPYGSARYRIDPVPQVTAGEDVAR